jgi:GNAT superfamily N-acetyltransferase
MAVIGVLFKEVIVITQEEKVEIVNRSLQDMVDLRPYSQIIMDDHLVQILTKIDYSILRNAVFWSVLDDSNAEETVRQKVAEYREKKLSFRWVVGPGSEPKNLSKILIRNGFQKVPNGFPGAGMVASYHTMKRQNITLIQDHYSLQVVEKKEQIEDFVRIMGTCFQYTVDNSEFLRIAIYDDIMAQPRRLWYFLVDYDSEPVGILAVRVYSDGFAYLSAGAVIPEYRRRGALKFLGHHVIEFLKDMGITTYTTQTLPNTSEKLSQKFGFETVCQVDTLICLYGQ